MQDLVEKVVGEALDTGSELDGMARQIAVVAIMQILEDNEIKAGVQARNSHLCFTIRCACRRPPVPSRLPSSVISASLRVAQLS